jgi:hypothetical protein
MPTVVDALGGTPKNAGISWQLSNVCDSASVKIEIECSHTSLCRASIKIAQNLLVERVERSAQLGASAVATGRNEQDPR